MQGELGRVFDSAVVRWWGWCVGVGVSAFLPSHVMPTLNVVVVGVVIFWVLWEEGKERRVRRKEALEEHVV